MEARGSYSTDSENESTDVEIVGGPEKVVQRDVGTDTDQASAVQTHKNRTRKFVQMLREVPWLVLIMLMLANAIQGIFYYGFPFFYVELLESLNGSASDVAWIGSIQMCVSIGTSIVFSGAMRRYGNRFVCLLGTAILCVSVAVSSLARNIYMLYFTYGVGGGLGLCALYLVTAVVSQQQFTKHRTFLTALVYFGYSFGQLISPVLVVLLVEAYTWRGALLIIAGLTSHNFIAGLLVPEKPAGSLRKQYTTPEHGSSAKSSSEMSKETQRNNNCLSAVCEAFDFTSLRHPPFLVYTLGTFFVRCASVAYMVHIPNWMIHHGISKREAAVLSMVESSTTLTLRPLVGLVADAFKVDRIALHVFGVPSMAMANFALLWGDGQGAIISSLLCCSVHISTWGPLVPVVVVDLLGVDNVAQGYAVVSLFYGAAVLVSPPFTGWVYDVTNSYNIPFYINNVMVLVGMSLLVAMFVLLRKDSLLKCRGVSSKREPQECDPEESDVLRKPLDHTEDNDTINCHKDDSSLDHNRPRSRSQSINAQHITI